MPERAISGLEIWQVTISFPSSFLKHPLQHPLQRGPRGRGLGPSPKPQSHRPELKNTDLREV